MAISQTESQEVKVNYTQKFQLRGERMGDVTGGYDIEMIRDRCIKLKQMAKLNVMLTEITWFTRNNFRLCTCNIPERTVVNLIYNITIIRFIKALECLVKYKDND